MIKENKTEKIIITPSCDYCDNHSRLESLIERNTKDICTLSKQYDKILTKISSFKTLMITSSFTIIINLIITIVAIVIKIIL